MPELIEGTKYDREKSPLDLFDEEAYEAVSDVLAFGARKYARHNWRKGIAWSRLIAAAKRHIAAFNRGEDYDPETGLPHTAHAMCCLMFLTWYLNHRREFDDRYFEANSATAPAAPGLLGAAQASQPALTQKHMWGISDTLTSPARV